MKSRKFLYLFIALTILLTSLLVAYRVRNIHIKSDVDYPYGATGWAWSTSNLVLTPSTGKLRGRMDYVSYTDDPEVLAYWWGKPMCGAIGKYQGMPAVVMVVKITRVAGAMPEERAGKYFKAIVTDGGENPEDDWMGLVVWDMITGPVEEMPSCEFEEPFYAWPISNGYIEFQP